MKLVSAILIGSLCLTLGAAASAQSLDQLNLVALNGKPLAKAATQNKVALVVNVASRCGYTRQYEGLQKLYDAYQNRGLVILGVPCNQFGFKNRGPRRK